MKRTPKIPKEITALLREAKRQDRAWDKERTKRHTILGRAERSTEAAVQHVNSLQVALNKARSAFEESRTARNAKLVAARGHLSIPELLDVIRAANEPKPEQVKPE